MLGGGRHWGRPAKRGQEIKGTDPLKWPGKKRGQTPKGNWGQTSKCERRGGGLGTDPKRREGERGGKGTGGEAGRELED